MTRNIKKNLKNIYEHIAIYIYTNRWLFIVGIIILTTIYGNQLYSINARIDNETLLNNYKGVNNWLKIGRQGGILTRIIFEQLEFNPYFASICAGLMLICSMIMFCYLMKYMGMDQTKISLFGFLIFMIHPIWMEQIYFTMQVLEISMGLFLTMLASFISYYLIFNNKTKWRIIPISLMIWSFSTYQTFIELYIAVVIFCFIVHLSVSKSKGKFEFKQQLIIIVNLIVDFTIAVVVNQIITKIFFLSSDYLIGQMQWFSEPIEICINNIFRHIFKVITGKGIFYSWSYIVSFILVIIFGIKLITKKNRMNSSVKYIYILALIGLELSPFLITIYGGKEPVYRSQFVLPFVISGNLILALILCEFKIITRSIIYFLMTIILVSQSQIVLRLQYTDNIRYQEDMAKAYNINEKIVYVTKGQNKPVAFVGKSSANLNSACVKGEVLGKSIFEWDYSAYPHYYKSSRRICNILRSMGIKISNVNENQMIEARKIANDMNEWPAEGSVHDAGTFVVVKLSADDFYDEDIMEPKCENIDEDFYIDLNNSSIRYSVDSIKIDKDIFVINGWMIQEEIPSNVANIHVYLRSNKSGKVYKIASTLKTRQDITKHFNNEINYNSSGFIAKGNISQIDGDIEDYNIILGYEKNKEKIYIDTNESIIRN